MRDAHLPLFGPAPLAAAAPGPGHAALAARLPTALRLGTSSWSFPGWAGPVWAMMPDVAAQAEVVPPAAGPGVVVVRWMLGHGLGYERARDRYAPFDRLAEPDPASRAGIAELCRAALALQKDVVVVVNNKAEGSAPRSVFALAEEIAGR